MAETVGERIRKVRGTTPQDQFASQLGIHSQTLGKYERGLMLPGGDVLGRFQETLGISIDWLLTGAGEMRLHAGGRPADPPPATATASTGGAPPMAASLNDDVLAAVVEGIASVYAEVGADLSPRDLGRLVTRVHGDVITAVADDDDPRVHHAVLRALLLQVMREAVAGKG